MSPKNNGKTIGFFLFLNMDKGKLYLIPVPLADNTKTASFTPHTLSLLNGIDEYIVENEKTARKFLKDAQIEIPQSQLVFHDYGKHARDIFEMKKAFQNLFAGKDIGVLSEAGCPGVADPGSKIVDFAHKNGIQVVPLVGPSSILLALMASGFNGQNFAFTGYLPISKNERIKVIKSLENKAHQENQTQIFMEAPFRNNKLLDDVLKTCKNTTRLCIASELTSEEEFIQTKTIVEWRSSKLDLHKKPSLFLLYK